MKSGKAIIQTLSVCAIFSGLLTSGEVCGSTEYTDEMERDYSIRSIGELEITNLRGGIKVQGWALDKIRVQAKRKVISDSEKQAREMLSNLDFRYRAAGGDIELSAQYGRGLDVEDRVRERLGSHSSMEMTVFAPSNLKLRIWTVDGQAEVSNWNADVSIRTNGGDIRTLDVSADEVSVFCVSCATFARNLKSSFRSIGSSGNVRAEKISGNRVFIETAIGQLALREIEGTQLYITRSGSIAGHLLKGRVEFYSREGSIDLQEVKGFISGRTLSGNVSIKVRKWDFDERALVESTTGNVSIYLPAPFQGELDAHSMFGSAKVAFPFRQKGMDLSYGPKPANHLMGVVGRGGDQLRIFSQTGNVAILRNL